MRRWPVSYVLAAPVAILAVLPLLVLLDLGAGADTLWDPHWLEVLGQSLALAGLTVVGSLLLGVPLAVMTAYVRLPLRGLWLPLLAAPLAMPSYIGAFTFYAAFGPGGEIQQLTGIPTPELRGLTGAAVVMSLYTFPFVLLTTRASLRGLDASVLDAARTLGLSLPQALWRAVLPRVRRGIAAGALLAALYTLSDFGTPAIMGVDTFTRVIFVEYNAFGLSQAAMLSLHLLVIVGLILFLESRFGTEQESPGRTLVLTPGALSGAGMMGVALLVFALAVGLPLALFGIWIARDGLAGFDPMTAVNSAWAAALAALGAVLLALPVAYAALAGPAGRVMDRLTYFGFGVPGIVMGTALVHLGLRVPVLYQTLFLLVLAYILRFLPLAVGAVRSTAERVDDNMTHAARLLGASRWEAFRRVSMPLTLRGVVAGGALVFLEAMRELPATLMLRPTGFDTLATELWRVYEAGYFGRAGVPGLLLVVISGVALVLMVSGERGLKAGLAENKG